MWVPPLLPPVIGAIDLDNLMIVPHGAFMEDPATPRGSARIRGGLTGLKEPVSVLAGLRESVVGRGATFEDAAADAALGDVLVLPEDCVGDRRLDFGRDKGGGCKGACKGGSGGGRRAGCGRGWFNLPRWCLSFSRDIVVESPDPSSLWPDILYSLDKH
jgi:hypothetical protein